MSLEFSTITLGDIVSLVIDYRGKTPKKLGSDWSEKGICALSAKNIKTGNIIREDTIRYVDEELYKKWMKDEIKRNDIIITSEAPFGEVFFWNSDEKIVLSQRLFGVRCNPEIVDPKFIYFYMTSDEFQWELQSRATGTTVKGLRQPELLKCEIKLPNFTIQKKISYLLSNIEDKIDCLKVLNKNLEEQLSLLFNDWFVNCTPFKNEELIKSEWGVVPESWKDIEFGELIEITSGNRPDEKSEDKTSEFNIPLFGASKIMGYTKEYSYNEDILIIGRVGTHGVVQRVNYPCFPSDNTFVIKSDYYGFVYQLLKRIDYDSLNTGSTQPLITQKSLKTVNAVLPDEKILSKFEMISKTIFDKIQLNNDEISKLTKLRDTLLPKLMSGEIDVSKINCDLELKYNYMKYLFNQIHTPMSKSVV